MHYRDGNGYEFRTHKKTPMTLIFIGIFVAAVTVGALAGLIFTNVSSESDAYWDNLSDAERIELCADYGTMGEEDMRELLEVFGTMSEEQELEFERTIEAAKEHC